MNRLGPRFFLPVPHLQNFSRAATGFIFLGMVLGFVFIHEAEVVQSAHCDTNARLPLEVNITKFPKTLVVKDGEKFDISFSMKVRRRLPVKYKIDIDLWKKMAFWVKIPCISGAGSCDYTFDCDKMNCIEYLSMCSKCKITVEDLTVTIPIDIDFPSFLVNGYYWVGYKIYNGKDNSKVACGENYFDIKI